MLVSWGEDGGGVMKWEGGDVQTEHADDYEADVGVEDVGDAEGEAEEYAEDAGPGRGMLARYSDGYPRVQRP